MVAGHNRVGNGAREDSECNGCIQYSPHLSNLAGEALGGVAPELCSNGGGSRGIGKNRDWARFKREEWKIRGRWCVPGSCGARSGGDGGRGSPAGPIYRAAMAVRSGEIFSPPADIFLAHACSLGSGTTPYDALAASLFTRCSSEVGSS
jgi:hypothetical protein